MNIEQHTDRPIYLRKWLLVVTLILNVFTFSGYTGNSQSSIQSFQTELAVSSPQVLEKSVDYVKFLRTSRSEGVQLNPNKAWMHALFAYNTAKKVEFQSVLNRYSSINSNHFWLVIKTIPQDSDEDSLVPTLG